MPSSERSASADQKCVKCGEATELLTMLPRFGEHPAYRIFECLTCRSMTWIAEQVGTSF
jgi:DNA-directed RNA polymerase subunit M/transcription elongation factor TFIIS